MRKTFALLAALTALALALTVSSSLASSGSRSAVATTSDDRGRALEPGDDRGGAVEPGDDRGTDAVVAKTTRRAKVRAHSHARRLHHRHEDRHGRDG